MSEWASVFAVFWLLWAVDGVRLAPRRIFTLIGRSPKDGRGRPGVTYDRWSFPGVLPSSWRVTASDVPLAVSPAGFCNRPVGAMGRPAERLETVRAWRWEEVREVGVAKGWIYVNGVRCCANTGHVRANELLVLAKKTQAERERVIRGWMARWFRPTHLQRRARVLVARTRLAVALNAGLLGVFLALTWYVVADVPARIPERWGTMVVNALPGLLLAIVITHTVAVISVWRGVRRLRAVAAEKRGSSLFSALMLPAQALRLRSLAGDGFFPAQHPAAVVAAFGRKREREAWFFNVFADLRWPLADEDEPALAREVVPWFERELEGRMRRLAKDCGVEAETLLAVPKPDGRASCTYCPRCRDQFVVGPQVCPEGIRLCSLRPAGGAGGGGRPVVCADDRGAVR